jgi:hypothetical protein
MVSWGIGWEISSPCSKLRIPAKIVGEYIGEGISTQRIPQTLFLPLRCVGRLSYHTVDTIMHHRISHHHHHIRSDQIFLIVISGYIEVR